MSTFYPPYSFGGDAVFVQRLARALAQRGHEVDVIHCRDAYRVKARREPTEAFIDEPGVTVHGLESPFGVLSPLATHQTGRPFFKTAAIERILASKPFDVIHYHNISLLGGPALLALGDAIKLYTLHEYWFTCPSHMLFKYNRTACESKACIRCQLTYSRPPQWWRYTDLMATSIPHVDLFLAPVEWVKRRHEAAGLQMPLRVLPHGFGSSSPAEPVALPTRPFFLFTGRLAKLKGLQSVIALFQHYREADLVIAGDGEYAEELRAQAAGADHIHFTGRLGPGQLRTLNEQCIAVLLPSESYEVFPMVILEAYAAGAPVIARAIGPLPELIEQSRGGLLFTDEASLLDAMERIRTDAALRTQLVDAGRAMWRDEWSDERHVERYLGIVGELQAKAAKKL
jgi:glycosyltransferase involved in cell wall biosynthesis